MKKKLPKSIKKYIRMEKARIRREVLELKEQEKLISELYKKLLKNQCKSTAVALIKKENKKKQPATPSPEGPRISANQH